MPTGGPQGSYRGAEGADVEGPGPGSAARTTATATGRAGEDEEEHRGHQARSLGKHQQQREWGH